MDLFRQLCITVSRWTHIPEQLIRFLIIGSVNTAFSYGIYAFFIFLGLHYTLAVLLSTIIGICFSFKTLGTLVFDNSDNMLIFKFFAVYGLCYFINIGILRLLSNSIVPNLYAAGLITCFIVALISFCLNKWVVFRKK